jgi:hypothetical protein
MITSSKKQTLTEVIKIIREKLGEAKDYLREMEKKKGVPRTFRRRLSAFLSAADSVTEIMQRQGMKYARQKGKGSAFEQWFNTKQDLFRTPQESKPKKAKNIGTNPVWVYLRSARHETIHVQQIGVHAQRKFEVNVLMIVREDKSICFEVMQDDGTVQQYEFAPGQPPPLSMQFMTRSEKGIPDSIERTKDEKIEPIQGQPLPLLKAVDTGEVLWGFTPLTIIGQGGNEIVVLDPPTDDVVTVCRNHIKKLEALIEECKTVLK